MAEGRRSGVAPQLDIEQILLEAQHRWLRPAEICEILRNYQKFHIAPEPPNKPASGSLFLFDRKVLRYFRKDGHNWRKKKDGKTVKEAHERLKAESVDVLHCYYAHGEDNENFQRRSYWLLDENFMHIVLVHYLEVKEDSVEVETDKIYTLKPGNKASFGRTRDQEIVQAAHSSNPASSNSFTNQSPQPSQTTDAESPNSTQTSEYEDAESDNYQRSSRYYPFLELQQYKDGAVMDPHLSNPYVSVSSLNNPYDNQFVATTSASDFFPVAEDSITKGFNESGLDFTISASRSQSELTCWDDDLRSSPVGFQSTSLQSRLATEAANVEEISRGGSLTFSELFTDDFSITPPDVSCAQSKAQWQLSNSDVGSLDFSNIEGSIEYPSLIKQLSLDLANKEGEGLKKYDSFSRWMSKELGEVDDSHTRTSSEIYWNPVESGSVLEDSGVASQDQLDAFLISPSLSQDQLFSISDFSPNWAYSGLKTEVLISGTFLKSRNELENFKWSCMFGEVEVPAEILADGSLHCHAPPHRTGRVPFYITCSNRLACSEVREFEFRVHPSHYKEYKTLHLRLEQLLSLESIDPPKLISSSSSGKPHLSYTIRSPSMEYDEYEWGNILKLTHAEVPFPDSVKDLLPQELLEQKLRAWLLHKVVEEGKGPNVLDKEGQGVIHLAAALGYDWAIEPMTTAGVSINFRDVHGRTALHWAAFCGRERTVVLLVTLGADPGALTDPTPEFPSGQTPADLASGNGHKGIAGFLAESSLTSHLSTLNLKESGGIDTAEVSSVIEDIADRSARQLADGDVQGGLSLKDSLSAVRNAAQAAARIHQVFRVQSFHRKKLVEYGHEKRGVSDERALSLVSVKTAKPGQHDSPAHLAATRIQNKFRGWKGRKDFLIMRQRIIKIQAHVRGHQVRKHYRKIIWSVGIVEKAILRWRRKGCGLRGFRSEGLLEGPAVQNHPSKEEDYDFLKEGRKQTEARLDKALARVKSMVQYPEARDQYRRLMTIVTELQESKVMQEDTPNESEEAADGDLMVELQEFLEDDMFMPAAL